MTLELELDLDDIEDHRYLGLQGIVQEKRTVFEKEPLEPIFSTGGIRTS